MRRPCASCVLELAARDPEVERILQLRAAARTGDPVGARRRAADLTTEALSTRRVRRLSGDPSTSAQDAEALLDELESHLEAGAADGVRPATAEGADPDCGSLTLNADDSGGCHRRFPRSGPRSLYAPFSAVRATRSG